MLLRENGLTCRKGSSILKVKKQLFPIRNHLVRDMNLQDGIPKQMEKGKLIVKMKGSR